LDRKSSKKMLRRKILRLNIINVLNDEYSRSGGLLGFGDEFDFDEGSLGQVLDCEGAASGVGGGEVLGIYFVHGAKISNVAQEYGGLYNIVEVEALALQDGAGIFQTLVGLFLDAALGEGSGLGDDGQLARNEYDVTGADGLAVRTNGSGSFVGV